MGADDGTRARSIEAFAALSREIGLVHDEPQLHDLIAQRAVDLVPAAEFCGITARRRRGRLDSIAVTDDVARRCDQLQYELGEGPCLAAALHDEVQLVRDTRHEPRWQEWGARVAELGVLSVLSVQLDAASVQAGHEPLGSLNLYASSVDAFDPEDVRAAGVYAVHAANALASARSIGGLHEAVDTRHLIGTAQGILIARHGLDLDSSFELLKRLSSTTNRKLRDVAAQVLEERGIPADMSDLAGLSGDRRTTDATNGATNGARA